MEHQLHPNRADPRRFFIPTPSPLCNTHPLPSSRRDANFFSNDLSTRTCARSIHLPFFNRNWILYVTGRIITNWKVDIKGINNTDLRFCLCVSFSNTFDIPYITIMAELICRRRVIERSRDFPKNIYPPKEEHIFQSALNNPTNFAWLYNNNDNSSSNRILNNRTWNIFVKKRRERWVI